MAVGSMQICHASQRFPRWCKDEHVCALHIATRNVAWRWAQCDFNMRQQDVHNGEQQHTLSTNIVSVALRSHGQVGFRLVRGGSSERPGCSHLAAIITYINAASPRGANMCATVMHASHGFAVAVGSTAIPQPVSHHAWTNKCNS